MKRDWPLFDVVFRGRHPCPGAGQPKNKVAAIEPPADRKIQRFACSISLSILAVNPGTRQAPASSPGAKTAIDARPSKPLTGLIISPPYLANPRPPHAHAEICPCELILTDSVCRAI